MKIIHRPRRNRNSSAIRELIRETKLEPSNFIYPIFIIDSDSAKIEIKSMPDVFRLGRAELKTEVGQAVELGIKSFALFPVIENSLKDPVATESMNPNGLLQNSIKKIKDTYPEVALFADVAMDPYSSDGHDGLVKDGKIVNDETLEILAEMALSQAKAGVDFVAPSDMMDGRVGFIRNALDSNGFVDVGILAYSAKYASGFYGPFRDALDSAPRFGDKKTYQMDPANALEALREAELDEYEGADMIMIKPALAYLDIIYRIRQNTNLPVAAYNVSGEYAMIKAASKLGWLDEKRTMMESLLSIKRAGADIILSYYALEAAKILS